MEIREIDSIINSVHPDVLIVFCKRVDVSPLPSLEKCDYSEVYDICTENIIWISACREDDVQNHRRHDTACPPSLVYQPIHGVIISACARRYVACKGGRCGYNEA